MTKNLALSTAQKVWIANRLLRVLLFFRRLVGRGPLTEVKRRGIRWKLDLREAIDFSIYLIGVFERDTAAAYAKHLKPGAVVLDIGANIGAHTLPMAQQVGPKGRVLAFEPTEFAFRKLTENLALNPEFLARVETFQMMLVANEGDTLQGEVYSSWPLLEDREARHALHCGKLQPIRGARAATLDDILASKKIAHVDFVKLDVDGNEWKVLAGGRRLFERDRPVLLIEFASYLFDSYFWEFESLIQFLAGLGYTFVDADSGVIYPLDAAEIRKMIPEGFSRNVIGRAFT